MQTVTCNPKKYFGIANDQCPAAFMAHFPCRPGAADHKLCKTQWHTQCKSFEQMRTTFLCEGSRSEGPGMNKVQDGLKSVGLYGGTCSCADGAVYLVGDEMNRCGSLACKNGVSGSCKTQVSNEWAFRRVECA